MNDYVQEIGESICIFIFITFYSSIPVISLCISSLFPFFFFIVNVSLYHFRLSSIFLNLSPPVHLSSLSFFLPSVFASFLPFLFYLLYFFLSLHFISDPSIPFSSCLPSILLSFFLACCLH